MTRIVLVAALSLTTAFLVPSAGASGEIGICFDAAEGALALVCVSEYSLTNSEDGECSRPDEGYYGIDSAYVSLAENAASVAVWGESTCWSGSGSDAYSSDSFAAQAQVAGHGVGAGSWEWSFEDGAGGSEGDCRQWLALATPDEGHVVERPCDGVAPPHPQWGRVLP